jgi:hypothetical protein
MGEAFWEVDASASDISASAHGDFEEEDAQNLFGPAAAAFEDFICGWVMARTRISSKLTKLVHHCTATDTRFYVVAPNRLKGGLLQIRHSHKLFNFNRLRFFVLSLLLFPLWRQIT